MNAAEYLADQTGNPPSLSASIAKIMLQQSPLHAWHAHPRLNPNYQPDEKAEFDYGTAAHSLLLEGDETNLVVVQADDWRTKAAREARDAARAEGKTPILERQLGKVKAMVYAAHAAIAKSELAGIFAAGQAERVVQWREGAVYCRSKLDFLPDDLRLILDYKSTTDASPEAFSRQIASLGYDIQASFYQRGVKAELGEELPFIFMAQEKDEPYACTFHGIAPSMKEIADAKVKRAIRLWEECTRTNTWPGYDIRIHWAEATAWQMTQHEQSLETA